MTTEDVDLETGTTAGEQEPRRSSWLTWLPIAVFVAIAGLFLYALKAGDPSKLPSALIGKPVPEFQLAAVEGLKAKGAPVPGFSNSDFPRDKVTIVNVWASWCVPCTREHPQLVALAERPDVVLFGINYKDQPSAARRFLGHYGNPFHRVGADTSGRVSVEWGLTGVPETFVVDRSGRITFKFIGELTETSLKRTLLPAIEAAMRSKP